VRQLLRHFSASARHDGRGTFARLYGVPGSFAPNVQTVLLTVSPHETLSPAGARECRKSPLDADPETQSTEPAMSMMPLERYPRADWDSQRRIPGARAALELDA
jgi:hypothetical protein